MGGWLFKVRGGPGAWHAHATLALPSVCVCSLPGFTSALQDKLLRMWKRMGVRGLVTQGWALGACVQPLGHDVEAPAASRLPCETHPLHVPAASPQGYQMTIYNQILYVTSFSATFSLLGLVSAGQLMPAIRWGRGAGEAYLACRACLQGQGCGPACAPLSGVERPGRGCAAAQAGCLLPLAATALLRAVVILICLYSSTHPG